MLLKYFTGGLAVTTAFAPLAIPAPAHAAPADLSQRTLAAPGVIDPSTLESCTAEFGLTKENSAFLSFDETVAGSATPVPHVGDGIVPVVTFDIGSGEQSCIPAKGWTDSASFELFVDFSPSGLLAYPGHAAWLVPTGGGNYFYAGGWPTYHVDLLLQSQFTDMWTVTWSTDIDLSPWVDTDATLIAAMRTALPDAVRNDWDAVGIGSQAWTCSDFSPALLAAIGTMIGPEAIDISGGDCGLMLMLLALQTAWALANDAGVVPVAISSEGAVALPSTGANTAPMAMAAAGAVGLGMALLRAGRRRPA